ncbi:hypothetical protein FHG87_005900 [Trinorchestia longiramus]|nr:hypothetical protein FHG87_005900 [Trinorchestia longiramus]
MRKRGKSFLAFWPGEKIFGPFRFLPLYFMAGAGLEFTMINWHFGEVNFYRTFKKRQVEELAAKLLEEEDARALRAAKRALKQQQQQ